MTSRGSGATAITLFGTGRLVASNVAEAKDAPRLVIDMPNVTSALPGVTPIAQGPIDAVRIALNPEAPLVTRVVLDMNRRAPYRVEQPSDGQTLTVVFDEVAADPISALRPVAAQAAPSQPGARQPAAPPQAAAQKQAAPPQAVARQANRAPAAAPQQPATQPPVTPAPLQPPSRFTGPRVPFLPPRSPMSPGDLPSRSCKLVRILSRCSSRGAAKCGFDRSRRPLRSHMQSMTGRMLFGGVQFVK